MDATTDTDEILESLVNRHSLQNVLDRLAAIASEKASRLRKLELPAAERWIRCAGMISDATARMDRL